jgi:hypothetical protein
VAGSIESQPQFGMAFVTVGDGDALAAPVFIQTSPGSSMTGRLVLEGAAEATVSGLRCVPTPVDLDYAPRDGKPASTSIAVGRDFELTGLTGPLRFDLDGRLPDGWWLKSVTIDGVNAADEPVTFRRVQPIASRVEVVLSNDAAEVSGQVAGAATPGQRRVDRRISDRAGAMVRAFALREGGARRSERAFHDRSLPPGEYWLPRPMRDSCRLTQVRHRLRTCSPRSRPARGGSRSAKAGECRGGPEAPMTRTAIALVSMLRVATVLSAVPQRDANPAAVSSAWRCLRRAVRQPAETRAGVRAVDGRSSPAGCDRRSGPLRRERRKRPRICTCAGEGWLRPADAAARP